MGRGDSSVDLRHWPDRCSFMFSGHLPTLLLGFGSKIQVAGLAKAQRAVSPHTLGGSLFGFWFMVDSAALTSLGPWPLALGGSGEQRVEERERTHRIGLALNLGSSKSFPLLPESLFIHSITKPQVSELLLRGAVFSDLSIPDPCTHKACILERWKTVMENK